MKTTQIIENLRSKIMNPVGRHLYGILGTYAQLRKFEKTLSEAKMPDGRRFPDALNVNRGILDRIPDDEFRTLVENEAKRPEPTAAYIANAFEAFLRHTLAQMNSDGVLILKNIELLFAYNVELNLLRALARDEDRILLLLPGKRSAGKAVMFYGLTEGNYILPINFIAENHLWEITD